MPLLKQNQFGIRSLLLLTVATAFAVTIGRYVFDHQETAFISAVIFSAVVGVLGLTMAGTGILFGIAILISEDCPKTRQFNLDQCGNMILYGLLGLAPIALTITLTYILKTCR